MFGKHFSNSITLRFLFTTFALFSFTQSAVAHLVSTGAGPFYDGTAHFFLTFEEILPVVALSLFAGLRGPGYGRWMIATLPVSWILGGILAIQLSQIVLPPVVMRIFLLLIPGVLVAFDWNLPLKAVIAIGLVFGLMLGFSNGSAFPDEMKMLGISGSAVAALIVVVFCSALAITLNRGWTRIAIRVAGSWITALGLLALGWSLRQ